MTDPAIHLLSESLFNNERQTVHVSPVIQIDMPLIPHTPESLLPRRADSKNPDTTCKGLCASGRPCRRSLTTPPKALPDPFHTSYASGGETTCRDNDLASKSFCWQHKNQAPQVSPMPVTVSSPYLQRSSIDTLVDRLGAINLKDSPVVGRDDSRRQLKPMSAAFTGGTPKSRRPQQTPRTRRSHGFWSSLCCVSGQDDDEYLEVVGHRKRVKSSSNKQEMVMANASPAITTRFAPEYTLRHHATFDTEHTRPDMQRISSCTSHSALIPQGLSLATRTSLEKELQKPISSSDVEGYIYMFWLTDSNSDKPSPSTISSVLSSPVSAAHNHMNESTTVTGNGKHILLKIGRTSNVHRRMSEWSRQCNYNLTLIRFYPYVPGLSSGTGSPARIRQVPCSKRVERLIHIELADQRVKQGKCTVCQKEHREWFQVEASRKGLRAVDEIIRRWVKWAEDSEVRLEPDV